MQLLQSAKLRNATVSFIMLLCLSVRLSVRMEQLGSCWVNFHENWCLSIFRQFVEEIQFSLETHKISGHFA